MVIYEPTKTIITHYGDDQLSLIFRLEEKDLDGLKRHGPSIEYRPFENTVYGWRNGVKFSETRTEDHGPVEDPDMDVLHSLFFRAYRNMSREGYTLEDFVGYTLLDENEIREDLTLGGNSFPDKRGRIYGAYFYTRGKMTQEYLIKEKPFYVVVDGEEKIYF